MDRRWGYDMLATSPASSFLRTLHRDIVASLGPEVDLTMRVAVLHAAGFTRAQIVGRLSASDVEVRMALTRLSRVAGGWDG